MERKFKQDPNQTFIITTNNNQKYSIQFSSNKQKSLLTSKYRYIRRVQINK